MGTCLAHGPTPWRPRPPRTPGSPWPPAAGSRLTSNPGTQFSAAPLPGSGSSSDRQVPEKVVERVCVCARVEEGGGKRKIVRASPTQCHRGQASAPYRPVRLHLVVELGSPVLQILRTGQEAGGYMLWSQTVAAASRPVSARPTFFKFATRDRSSFRDCCSTCESVER